MNDDITDVGRSTLVAMVTLFLQSVLKPLNNRNTVPDIRQGLGRALIYICHTALTINSFGRINTDDSIFNCCPSAAGYKRKSNSFGVSGPVNRTDHFGLTFAGNGLFFLGLYHAMSDFKVQTARTIEKFRDDLADIFDAIDYALSEFLSDISQVAMVLERHLVQAGVDPMMLEKDDRLDFDSLSFEAFQKLHDLDFDEDILEITLISNNLSCCPRCQRDVRTYDFPELGEFYDMLDNPPEEE